MSRDATTDGGSDGDAADNAPADGDSPAGPLDGVTVIEAGSMISIGTVEIGRASCRERVSNCV